MNTLFMKGPLHPDLFGGETPVMVPIRLGEGMHAFEVKVSGVCYSLVIETLACYLVAPDAREAADRARVLWTDHYGSMYEKISEDPDCDPSKLQNDDITPEIAAQLQESLDVDSSIAYIKERDGSINSAKYGRVIL